MSETTEDKANADVADRFDGVFMRIRYFIIEMLAGDMPVVINMTITRPNRFKGALVYFPDPKLPGIFTKNTLLSTEGRNILTPTRDMDETDA